MTIELTTRLHAQVLESPHDRQLRQVYADHLLDLGDPRGELISLQLAGSDHARVAALIAEHGNAWLGPLEPWVQRSACAFDGGFLSEVKLASDRELAPIIGDPTWATVRSLHLGNVARSNKLRAFLRSVAHLIAHPVMRSLVQITIGNGEGLMIERDHEGVLGFVPRFR